MLKPVRWGLLVIVAVVVCACGSGRARTRTQAEGSDSAGSAPTTRQQVRVLPYCEISGGRVGEFIGNHPLDDVDVDVDIALEGAETVTAEPDGGGVLPVGSKAPMRVLLNLKCSADFPSGQPYSVARAERWFKRAGWPRVNYCKATTLDLTSLDAGKPYSTILHPIVLDDWKIQSLSPDLSNIEIGSFDKRLGEIRITGAHRCVGDLSSFCPLPGQLDTGGAQIAWDYAEGDGDGSLGASRVDLAVDCPTLQAEAAAAAGSDLTF